MTSPIRRAKRREKRLGHLARRYRLWEPMMRLYRASQLWAVRSLHNLRTTNVPAWDARQMSETQP
jgi:hypothetical protein